MNVGITVVVLTVERGHIRGSSAGDYFAYDVLGRTPLKIQQTGGVNYHRTPNKVGHIDLKGKGHFDKATGGVIATPHVQERVIHQQAGGGRTNVGRQTTRAATKQDIRTARRIVERRRRE